MTIIENAEVASEAAKTVKTKSPEAASVSKNLDSFDGPDSPNSNTLQEKSEETIPNYMDWIAPLSTQALRIRMGTGIDSAECGRRFSHS